MADNKYSEAIAGLEQAIAEERKVIEVAEENIRSFEISINRLRTLNGNNQAAAIETKGGFQIFNSNTIVPPNGTVIKWAIEQLRTDDYPQTTRMLFEKYLKVVKDAPAFATFSGIISGYLTKPDIIRRHIIDGNPNSIKNWFGLPAWFDNDRLKKEYLDRIKKLLTNQMVSQEL